MPNLIRTQLGVDECLASLDEESSLIPIGSNSVLVGTVGTDSFRLSLTSSVLAVGWAAPVARGVLSEAEEGTLISVAWSKPIGLKIVAGLFYLIAAIAIVISILVVLVDRRISSIPVPGVVFAAVGLLSGAFLQSADRMFSSESDWRRLINAISKVVNGEPVGS